MKSTSFDTESLQFQVRYDPQEIDPEQIKAKLRTEEAGPAGPYEVKEWSVDR